MRNPNPNPHLNPNPNLNPNSTATTSTSSKKTTPCCSKVGMKRGPWTAEEDEILGKYIRREGEGRWRTLPKRAGLLRCGKSCRLRWMNYLRPSVKRGHIAPDEEDLILRLHRLLGNRWSLIAGRIPGRTDNEIKNYWNTHLSKKLISQGIDPRTHKPLNPNSSIDSTNIKPSFSSSNAIIIPNPNPNPNPNLAVISPNFEDINNNSKNLENNIGGAVISSSEEADDINCCNDDVFSSFLNSLINEDVLMINSSSTTAAAQQHQAVVQNNQSIGIESEQPLMMISSTSAIQSNFAFGDAGWDAPIMNASSATTVVANANTHLCLICPSG